MRKAEELTPWAPQSRNLPADPKQVNRDIISRLRAKYHEFVSLFLAFARSFFGALDLYRWARMKSFQNF